MRESNGEEEIMLPRKKKKSQAKLTKVRGGKKT